MMPNARAGSDVRDVTALGDAYKSAVATPFVSTYSCDQSFCFPEGFSAKKYRGLLLCAVVQGGESATIHACWKNRDSLETDEPAFKAELHLEGARSRGPVAQLATLRSPWWKRHSISLGKAVLGLAALFGALSAIRDYFADLFVPPYISAYVQETASVDYPEGSRLVIPIKILNHGRFGRAIVALRGATLRSKVGPANSIPLELDTHDAQLPPGQIVEAHVLGTAPTLQRRDGPQDYELDVPMSASAGYFAGSRSVAFQKRTFKIWSDLAWRSSFNLVPSNNEVAYVALYIHSGRAFSSGTKGYLLADLPEAPDRVELVCCNATKINLIYSSGTKYRCKLEFKTGPLPAFQTSVQQVAIAFKRDLTPPEWERVSKSIQIRIDGGEI
jgi:hypothetical protein